MKILQLAIAFFSVASSLLSAEGFKTTLELSQGYRQDKLDVKFKRHFSGDSYREHDRYDKIDIYSTRLAVTVAKEDYFLYGLASYGNVTHGHYHETSKLTDPDFSEHFSKKSDITDDYVADFALNFGKNFHLAHGFTVAPTIGYRVALQDFHTNRGKQHFSSPGFSHKQKGRKERLRTTWYSPQIGVNLLANVTHSLDLFCNYSFLYPLNYDAKRTFEKGQMTHTVHHSQENKASKSLGHVLTAGGTWRFAKQWFLKPEFELMKFYSKDGDYAHRYHLQTVNRTSMEGRLTLGYFF